MAGRSRLWPRIMERRGALDNVARKRTGKPRVNFAAEEGIMNDVQNNEMLIKN